MKKRHGTIIKIVSILLVSIFLITGYVYMQEQYMFLPSTFTARLGQDATSSGGSRYTSATLHFTNSKLDQGTLTYRHSRETTTTIACTLQNQKWVNIDGTPCTISFISPPLTKKEFQTLIESKQIRPVGDTCRRFDICFSLEK